MNNKNGGDGQIDSEMRGGWWGSFLPFFFFFFSSIFPHVPVYIREMVFSVMRNNPKGGLQFVIVGVILIYRVRFFFTQYINFLPDIVFPCPFTPILFCWPKGEWHPSETQVKLSHTKSAQLCYLHRYHR